jgi:hypothetical protein
MRLSDLLRGRLVWKSLLPVTPLVVLAVCWFLVPAAAWLISMALVALFVLGVGYIVVGIPLGALVDARNKVSLSRFQTVLWTVLVVSAYLAAAVNNVRTAQEAPLKIVVPKELWILLGISTASLVGSGLIKQEKCDQAPDPDRAKASLAKSEKRSPDDVVAVDGNQLTLDDKVVSVGLMTVNASPDASSWLDMFKAEEVGNAGGLDLGKIQMFFFTVIIVLAYAVAVGSLLASEKGKISNLPALDQSAVALIGISHAAYLVNKAIPSTSTA